MAVMNAESTKRVITYFVICPNGVQCYDRELEGLVETSLNLGIVETTKDAVKLESLVRSSMESKKADMKEILDTWYSGHLHSYISVSHPDISGPKD